MAVLLVALIFEKRKCESRFFDFMLKEFQICVVHFLFTSIKRASSDGIQGSGVQIRVGEESRERAIGDFLGLFY